MRFIIPTLCVLVLTAQAQYGTLTDSEVPERGMSGSMQPLFEIPAHHPPPDVEQLSHEGLSSETRNTVATSGVVSPVWAGSISHVNLMQSDMTALQLGTGFLAMHSPAVSNLQGSGIFASVVPIYFGVRRNLAVTTTSNMEWTQYAVAGAGPLMGIEHPQAASFWQSFSRMSFRWGAGGYAGLGSEMRFDHGLGLYAQLELTGFGFTAPLLDRQTFFGPSISFGLMFFPR